MPSAYRFKSCYPHHLKIAGNSDFFVCKLSFRIIFILLQFFTVFYNSLLFYISFTVLYCLKKLLCSFETQELFSKANLPSMSLNKLLIGLGIQLFSGFLRWNIFSFSNDKCIAVKLYWSQLLDGRLP